MSAGDDPIRPGPADGDEADAWLRAALRHAPDAQAGAPPALSAAILRQAAAATSDAMSGAMSRNAATGAARRPAAPSLWRRLMTAWVWLAQAPVAAGFASVMLASVVGLMWWDRPLSEALPERAPEATARPLPPVAPAQAAPEEATNGAVDASARAIKAAPTATATATASADKAAKPLDPSAERRPVAPDAALGKARPAPRARLVTPVSEPARRESSELLADAAPAPAPAPAPALAQEQERAPTQAHAPASPPPRAAPAPMAAVPAMRAEADPKLSTRPREARLSAAPAPLLTELRAALRAEPQRWAWQRGTGAEQPMTPALRAWLDRLGDGHVADTAAPESAKSMVPPSAAALASASTSASTSVTELRLLRDGQLHTTLSLGAAHLRLAPADARRTPLHMALSPQAAAELNASLDAAAP